MNWFENLKYAHKGQSRKDASRNNNKLFWKAFSSPAKFSIFLMEGKPSLLSWIVGWFWLEKFKAVQCSLRSKPLSTDPSSMSSCNVIWRNEQSNLISLLNHHCHEIESMIWDTLHRFFNPILLGGGQICPPTFFWKNYSAELYECHIFWLLEIFSINLDLNNFQKKKTG